MNISIALSAEMILVWLSKFLEVSEPTAFLNITRLIVFTPTLTAHLKQ